MTRPAIDKSFDGKSLQIAGRTFDHGLGMRARQQVLLELDGRASRFSAWVGVDDSSVAKYAVIEFRLLGDARKLLWKSGPLKQGQPPVEVSVDVTGVKQLTLLTFEPGGESWSGFGDWADPQLDVTGAPPRMLDPDAPARAFELGLQVAIATNGPSSKPTINLPGIVAVRPNTPLLFSVPVSGEPPLDFSARHLPKGLELDSATGIIHGSLRKNGNWNVSIKVRNRAGSDKREIQIAASEVLAVTPPMGWNSFDNFGGGVKESEVLEEAGYMATRMKQFGWRYVVIDYLWFDPMTGGAKVLAMDRNGRLQPATNRFPSCSDGQGFKPLADKVHAVGLSFGIHIMRGIPRQAVELNTPIQNSDFHAADAADTNSVCGWNNDMYGVRGAAPAGRAYYDSLFQLYAAWGVDYVKVDDISSPYHAEEIEAIRAAIDKCGRSIVLSLSPGPAPLDKASHLVHNANLWRETGDFWDNWDQLELQFEKGLAWKPYVGPGHWPDADMLPVGHIGDQCVGLPRTSNLSRPEQMTLISLWAIQSSPLMVGADLRKNDPWTLALLSNPEVLAVDQDASGTGAVRVSKNTDSEVWKKALSNGTMAVGLFNRGEQPADIGVSWSDLGLSGRHSVRDLWLRYNVGNFGTEFKMKVAPHGAAMIIVGSK